jgi:hypothetical protein
MADWEIKKTLGQCFGTGKEFEVGQEYFAALVETEAGWSGGITTWRNRGTVT